MTTSAQPSRAGDESGFTLVELLIGVSILVIGLLALLMTLSGAMRFQSLAGNRAEMVMLAEAKLDEMRMAAVKSTADTVQIAVGGSLTTSSAPHADVVVGPGGRTYTRRWQVTAGPGGSRSVTLRIAPQVDNIRTPAQIDLTTRVVKP